MNARPATLARIAAILALLCIAGFMGILRSAREAPALQSSILRPRNDTPKEAVDRLRSMLTSAAGTVHCEVSAMAPASDVQPMASAYDKTATAHPGWGQIETTLMLRGTTAAVIHTLREIPSMPVPTEIESVQIRRVISDSAGNASVSASVVLRLLVRKESLR